MEVTFFSLMRTSEFTSFFLKEVLDFKTFRLGPQLIAVTMNMIHAKKGMGSSTRQLSINKHTFIHKVLGSDRSSKCALHMICIRLYETKPKTKPIKGALFKKMFYAPQKYKTIVNSFE